MLKRFLALGDAETLTEVQPYLRHSWVWAILLVALALAVSVYAYRRESILSRPMRVFMGLCQGLTLALLLVLLLEPMLGLELTKPFKRTFVILADSSASMTVADPLETPREWLDSARALGVVAPDATELPLDISGRREALLMKSRFERAQGLLANPQLDLLSRLSEFHEVRLFTFDDALHAAETSEDGDPLPWLAGLQAEGDATRLGDAVAEGVGRFSGQPVAGVLLLSDFIWNKGEDPESAARALGERGVPIFAMGLGQPAPKDLLVQRIVAPDVAFVEDKVPIRVQLESRGFAGQTAGLTLVVGDKEHEKKTVTLEEGVQYEELLYEPGKRAGSFELELRIEPLEGEITEENNRLGKRIKIIDEKIKVLYVEGMPRWEYRYLRWVLLRDKRLDVKFLMTMGDPQLANTSAMHLPRYPEDPEEAFAYDVIILGDVPSRMFTPEQLKRMDELVRTRGGSLIMIAGPVGAPSSYKNTALEAMLPVKLGSARWLRVPAVQRPRLTPDGYLSNIGQLELPAERNDRLWSHIWPLDVLPQLDGPKPAATVLLTLTGGEEDADPYPLIAWQRYGNGKCMYVGTEDIWRLRLEVGDLYHARFWGQAIQFMALSRLLGANKQINLETDRAAYSTGEHVQIFANVLNAGFEPRIHQSYTVHIEREDLPGQSIEVDLQPVPDVPGLYSESYLVLHDGNYRILATPNDREHASSAEFVVDTVPLEQRGTAMDESVLRAMAELSGGEVLDMDALAALPDRLDKDIPVRTIRTERDLWDLPAIFVLILILCSIEWFFRRRENLV